MHVYRTDGRTDGRIDIGRMELQKDGVNSKSTAKIAKWLNAIVGVKKGL